MIMERGEFWSDQHHHVIDPRCPQNVAKHIRRSIIIHRQIHVQDVNVFSFAGGLVRTTYKAVRLVTTADGSYSIDTTDKRFADTVTRKFDPNIDGNLANYNNVRQLGTKNGFTQVNYAAAPPATERLVKVIWLRKYMHARQPCCVPHVCCLLKCPATVAVT